VCGGGMAMVARMMQRHARSSSLCLALEERVSRRLEGQLHPAGGQSGSDRASAYTYLDEQNRSRLLRDHPSGGRCLCTACNDRSEPSKRRGAQRDIREEDAQAAPCRRSASRLRQQDRHRPIRRRGAARQRPRSLERRLDVSQEAPSRTRRPAMGPELIECRRADGPTPSRRDCRERRPTGGRHGPCRRRCIPSTCRH
jgi:hypothetical protein